MTLLKQKKDFQNQREIEGFDGTEINGKGPGICREDMEQFLEKLEKLKAGDVLVLAGSIPESLPNSIYRDIMAKLQGKGIHFAVDATGELLLNVLQYRPFLIKPNNHELGEIFGVEIRTREEAVPYARKNAGKRSQKRTGVHGRTRRCAGSRGWTGLRAACT